jgi:hypothetical protein
MASEERSADAKRRAKAMAKRMVDGFRGWVRYRDYQEMLRTEGRVALGIEPLAPLLEELWAYDIPTMPHGRDGLAFLTVSGVEDFLRWTKARYAPRLETKSNGRIRLVVRFPVEDVPMLVERLKED